MGKPHIIMLVMVRTMAILLTPVSGTVETEKYVCPGDSVQIFEDIDYDRCNGDLSLSMNGKRNVQIASWSFKNCTLNATVLKEYKNRIFRDQNGTITISKLHHFDHTKYVFKAEYNTSVSIKEVEIYVMDAPSKDCKPKIERFGNMLHAALLSDGCGDPVTTLYWRNVDDDLLLTREPLLPIVPGKEPRAYYACIEGPALKCTQSLTPLDYCSPYVIEGSKTFDNRGTELYIATLIVGAINLVVSILTVVIGVLYIERCTNKSNAAGKSVQKKQHKIDVPIESELQKLHETNFSLSIETGEAELVNDSDTERKFQYLQSVFLLMRYFLNQVPEELLTYKRNATWKSVPKNQYKCGSAIESELQKLHRTDVYKMRGEAEIVTEHPNH